MNNLRRVKLGSFFTQSVAGEWGSEPTGIDDVTVYRAADFSKDCKLNVTEGALRSVPKSKLSNRKLNRNDILVEKSGGSPTQPVGRAVIYKPESDEQVATCSNFLQRLVVDEEYSPEFVYYLMLGLYQDNATLPYQQQTTGIYNLKLEEYLQTEVDTYVDRNLQEKVADILSTIDNQIDATQALIDKYTAIKQGMMADLFSRGIDPETKVLRPTFEEAPELYHETPLGLLPKGWDVSDLGSISLRVTDGSHQAVSTVENGDIPFLFVSCVRGGKILWDKCSYISKEDYHLISKGREPRKGDILYTAVGSYGHAALVSEDSEFSFQRHIAYIKPNNQFVDSSFLSEFLNSEQTKSWADRVALGNAQKTVTLGELSKFPIVVPGKIEQEKIVVSLQRVNEVLESEYADLSKLQQTKQGLMQDLLTGKVPVPA